MQLNDKVAIVTGVIAASRGSNDERSRVDAHAHGKVDTVVGADLPIAVR